MIQIYGNDMCGWCHKSKDLAESYGLKYQWLNTDDQDILNELKTKKPDVKTIPQIWWHDKYIGGYEDFVSELQSTIGNYGQDQL